MYGQLRNESAILIMEKNGKLNQFKQDSILANPRYNTRELLVSMLAEIPGLTCQQIHQLIQRIMPAPISVQATHKTLQQLNLQRVVSKTNRKYYLNIDWVKQTKNFYQTIEEKVQQSNEITLIVK